MARTITYGYVRVGNRTSRADSGETAMPPFNNVTYTYNANDRLVTEARGQGGTAGYTYDAAGHVLTRSANEVTPGARFTWDIGGRLVRAEITTGTTSDTDYTYNPGGIRVSQGVHNQAPTKSLIDETAAYDQVLEEYAPGGALAASYIRGHDLLFQDRGGTKSYAVKDGLGSIRAVTNASATVTDTLTYDAFGRDFGRTGTTVLAFQYAGEQLDANTKQYYLRARYYDAAAGRFTSRDTDEGRASEPITQNHYVYAGADPVNYSDPSGHFSLAVNIVGIGILSGLVGIGVNGLANHACNQPFFENWETAFGGGFFIGPLATIVPGAGLILA